MKMLVWSAGLILSVGVLYYLVLSRLPGVSVTSWFRTPWHNAAVGGMTWSLHQIGWAFDLVPNTMMTQAEVAKSGLPFLKFQPEADHLHVQIF